MQCRHAFNLFQSHPWLDFSGTIDGYCQDEEGDKRARRKDFRSQTSPRPFKHPFPEKLFQLEVHEFGILDGGVVRAVGDDEQFTAGNLLLYELRDGQRRHLVHGSGGDERGDLHFWQDVPRRVLVHPQHEPSPNPADAQVTSHPRYKEMVMYSEFDFM